MILIKDGPDIPEAVLHALRNDNLVFFCGAGISRQNGLPLFNELVKQVCEKLNIPIDEKPLLQEAMEEKKYDHILDLAEGNQDFSVSKATLRKEIIEILSQYKNDAVIHKDLLDLSVLSNNKGYRLVTTNVDRLFHEAKFNKELSDIGPKLAPPRKGKWKNLTFLHGLIDKENDPEGEGLTLTRTDFGLAYLYDHWASRFVIQLFQEFTVLFIGYSIDDPVMNYLVSAISTENRRKNNEDKTNSQNIEINKHKSSSIYAFIGYEEGKEKLKKEKWQSMGITPILYKNVDGHSLLYDTIKKWATLKNTGLSGRKQWLREQLKCDGKFPKEFQVSDKWEVKSVFSFLRVDEKLAEYLPQINPHISLLELISELPVNETTQQKSNIETHSQDKSKLLDNLVLPKFLTRSNGVVSITESDSLIWKECLSPLEQNIIHWLCKHLDKKELIHWVIERNCNLHPMFKKCIQWKITELEQKPSHSNTEQQNSELELNGKQYLFWNTIIDLNYFPRDNCSDLLRLVRDLNKQYCLVKIQKLLNLLEPYISFGKALYIEGLYESNEIYEPKIRINSRSYPPQLTNEEILLKHAEDFSDLLKKAMEKAKQFGIGEDSFFRDRPSIEIHSQNETFYPWTYLIDLARDSFDRAMEEEDKALANFLLQKWQQYPYSVFYKLILYAVTYNSLDEKYVIKLLKNNKHHILWSENYSEAVLKYLKKREHSAQVVKELESLIIKGPPQKEYTERDIYDRLNCLKHSSGTQLSKKGQDYCKQIQEKYNLSDSIPLDDRGDFSSHSTKARIVGSEKKYHNLLPQQIYEDIKCINSNTPEYEKDDKRENFRYLVQDKPEKAYETLLLFQDKEVKTPPYHFSPFFGVFMSEIEGISDKKSKKKYFFDILSKIESCSDDFFKKSLWSYVHSFKSFSVNIYSKDKSYFHQWWHQLWKLSVEKNTIKSDSSFNIRREALDLSPLGKLSECVFDVLWSRYPDNIPKDDKIPEDIESYFKVILEDAEKTPFVLYQFGIDLCVLWYLDKEWVLENIKPLINWDEQVIFCKSIWEGYLYNPKLSQQFAVEFKKEFFELFLERKNLCKSFSDNENELFLREIDDLFFLTTGGSWLENIFSDEEIKQLKKKKKIDIDMLNSISHQIWVLLKDTEEKSGTLWSEKIKPWIEKFWPSQTKMKTDEIAQNFSLAVLYSGCQLPDALDTLEPYIEDNIQRNNDMITYHINKSCFDFEKDQPESRLTKPHQLDYVFKYPEELLKLLNWNFSKPIEMSYLKTELKEILDKIENEHPEIKENEDYTQLIEKL